VDVDARKESLKVRTPKSALKNIALARLSDVKHFDRWWLPSLRQGWFHVRNCQLFETSSQLANR
jgi:hypothetical protein